MELSGDVQVCLDEGRRTLHEVYNWNTPQDAIRSLASVVIESAEAICRQLQRTRS